MFKENSNKAEKVPTGQTTRWRKPVTSYENGNGIQKKDTGFTPSQNKNIIDN